MDAQPFLIKTLALVATALEQAGIAYALAGGLAYSALVEPRATVDMDFLVVSDEAGRGALLTALAPHFDSLFPHAEPMVLTGATIWRVVCVQGVREIIVDFLLGDGDFHQAALDRRQFIEFSGIHLAIVTPEDLYLLKARSVRPQDRLDMDRVRQHYGAALDQDYIKGWLSRWKPKG